jgi:hypothetical protein
MIPPYRTGVMHSPPIPPTTPNRPIPNTPPTPPPPGFDYSSAVDATGGHITELLHNIFQHHYIHLLPPIIDQIHVPPNQNTASLATVCCEHIFHLTAPLSPTVDITHRHLLTLTVALLLYSPNIREHITSLLFTPLIHHLSCVITQQHMANIRSSFHAHITWFDLVDLNQCTYSPPPFPQPLLTSSPPATPTHRRLTKLLHYLTLTLTVFQHKLINEVIHTTTNTSSPHRSLRLPLPNLPTQTPQLNPQPLPLSPTPTSPLCLLPLHSPLNPKSRNLPDPPKSPLPMSSPLRHPPHTPPIPHTPCSTHLSPSLSMIQIP